MESDGKRDVRSLGWNFSRFEINREGISLGWRTREGFVRRRSGANSGATLIGGAGSPKKIEVGIGNRIGAGHHRPDTLGRAGLGDVTCRAVREVDEARVPSALAGAGTARRHGRVLGRYGHEWP